MGKAEARAGQVVLYDGSGAAITNNAHRQVYHYVSPNRIWNWANTVVSHLLANEDGTFTRVEYYFNCLIVENYSADLTFLDSRIIEQELPMYGGFYAGRDAFFVVLTDGFGLIVA